MLVKIDGGEFYRIGDLVRFDRKDHQVKIPGQRIEQSEIERCLLSVLLSSHCLCSECKYNGRGVEKTCY